MSNMFPNSADFSGALHPMRVEFSARDLEFEGSIPTALRGAFVRVQPDPQFPPKSGDDIFFNGDGAVTRIAFANGRADIRHRYVATEKFRREGAARRALFGRYRNRYTDDPSVLGLDRTTANTNVVPFDGKLLAMKEDGLPYVLDPVTLATSGRFDFDGQLTSETFTAHPKIDPDSGDMHSVSIEARGDGTRDVAYWAFDRRGRKLEEVWFHAPFCGMLHDFGVTPNYVVFPLIPITVDVERMKAGGSHFEWQPEQEMIFGILQRGRDAQAIRWFKGPPGFQGHILNVFEDGARVFADLSIANGNVFPFFPDRNGHSTPLDQLRAPLKRCCFTLSSPSDSMAISELGNLNMEFGRVDDRYAGRLYRHAFLLAQDWSKPYDVVRVGAPHPFFFNELVHVDLATGRESVWWPGAAESLQEPVFVPRSPSAPEGDGYVIAVVNRLAERASDIVVLDASDISAGPVAVIRTPVRLRMGLHGNWVPEA